MNQRLDSETGYVVCEFRLLGTNTRLFSAYAPSLPSEGMRYHTYFTIDGLSHGRVGTECIPKGMDALPAGEERTRRVRAYRELCHQAACAAIVRTFPEATHGRHSSYGEIELTG